MTTEKFVEELNRQYNRLNYQEFCQIIGEPVTINGLDNTYALEKWDAFHELVAACSKLGTFLPKIVNI